MVDDFTTSSSRVFSEVPQGAKQGPSFLKIYIDNISSGIRLFANGAFLYSKIVSQQDRVNFQADLLQSEHKLHNRN